jgi:protein-tyrosine-phosphatase
VKDRNMKKKTVLFICIGNSGRSLMAEDFFEQVSKEWNAASAGIRADEKIHPWTVELMKEIGIDMSRRRPKLLKSEMLKEAERIVAIDSDALKQMPPEFLSKTDNWNISPFLGKQMDEVRQTRDTIKRRCNSF